MLRSSRSRSALVLALSLTAAACSGSPASIGDSHATGSGSGSGSGTSGGGSGSGTGDGIAGADAEGLFDAPSDTSATPGSIYGLWGGAMKDMDWTFDSRIRLSAGAFTFATQCISPSGVSGGIAAIRAKARVDANQIAILESRNDEKKVGEINCRANAHPGETNRCAEVDGFQTNCFVLEGTSLTFYGATPFDKMEMTKISD